MTKSLKVSPDVHAAAKAKAAEAGMNLQSFVERAIQKFNPRIVFESAKPIRERGRKRIAG